MNPDESWVEEVFNAEVMAEIRKLWAEPYWARHWAKVKAKHDDYDDEDIEYDRDDDEEERERKRRKRNALSSNFGPNKLKGEISQSKRDEWARIMSLSQPPVSPQLKFCDEVMLEFAGNQIIAHGDVWQKCYRLKDEDETEAHIIKLVGDVVIHWKKDEDELTGDFPF